MKTSHDIQINKGTMHETRVPEYFSQDGMIFTVNASNFYLKKI